MAKKTPTQNSLPPEGHASKAEWYARQVLAGKILASQYAVSYTHLTLPTILLV